MLPFSCLYISTLYFLRSFCFVLRYWWTGESVEVGPQFERFRYRFSAAWHSMRAEWAPTLTGQLGEQQTELLLRVIEQKEWADQSLNHAHFGVCPLKSLKEQNSCVSLLGYFVNVFFWATDLIEMIKSPEKFGSGEVKLTVHYYSRLCGADGGSLLGLAFKRFFFYPYLLFLPPIFVSRLPASVLICFWPDETLLLLDHKRAIDLTVRRTAISAGNR